MQVFWHFFLCKNHTEKKYIYYVYILNQYKKIRKILSILLLSYGYPTGMMCG